MADGRLLTRPPLAAVLTVAALVFWWLHASTLGGMGRSVGGELVTTAYTFFWLFVWPVAFFLMARRYEGASARARALRRFGYVSGPLLYMGIVFWTPGRVWERLGLKDVWFNYFGETAVFTQSAKAVVFGALTALVLEQTRRRV